MRENVQREGSRDCKKESPEFESRKKNEEIISKNCQPHHKTDSSFINTHKAAPLYLLCMFSRNYAMSESVQRDDIARHSTTSFIFAMTGIAHLSTLKG
jgi:hypothetical protein